MAERLWEVLHITDQAAFLDTQGATPFVTGGRMLTQFVSSVGHFSTQRQSSGGMPSGIIERGPPLHPSGAVPSSWRGSSTMGAFGGGIDPLAAQKEAQ